MNQPAGGIAHPDQPARKSQKRKGGVYTTKAGGKKSSIIQTLEEKK